VPYKTLWVNFALQVIVAAAALGQTSTSGSSTSPPYVPGVTFQTTNPNYPLPNPFYFEGRIDWNLLGITTPTTAWDFEQRGIYEQDDLNDLTDAIADYKQAITLNGLANGTCQIVTGAIPTSGTLNPPPCMITVRLRLAGLMQQSAPQQAIALYQQVIAIDPLMLSVHTAMAQTYALMAPTEATTTATAADYNQAIVQYQAELALSPVTSFTTALTADLANNAHVHWELAAIYQTLGNSTQEASELQLYLLATMWHSDTYPWRIKLAMSKLAAMGIVPDLTKPTTVSNPKLKPAEVKTKGKPVVKNP
jgi:tetratricopeptide (TPR) repeat protein